MPIHVLQCNSSCRILPVEALEDPVLEQRVHGYRHNGDKGVDGCFLQHGGCNQKIFTTSRSAPRQLLYACITIDICGSQQKALVLAAAGSRVCEEEVFRQKLTFEHNSVSSCNLPNCKC